MLVVPHSTAAFARREAGGKGFALYLASSLNFPVPAWVVIGRSDGTRFIDENDLTSKIVEILKRHVLERISVEAASEEIARLITIAPATQRLQQSMEQALAIIGPGKSVAIRSSAADEDGSRHSFAGQLSSYLNIRTLDEALDAYKKCLASAYSARALVYRRTNGLSLMAVQVAVVVQEMLTPDISGVLFTCDPIAMNDETWLASAVYGVGEGLVSGALDADTYWIDPDTGRVARNSIVEKAEALQAGRAAGLVKQVVPPDQQNVPALAEAEISKLHALGSELVRAFGQPQDVEWAFAGGKLFLLQTRPVTALPTAIHGFPNLWDNSNIVESYGGITLPLSFTFALGNYRVVYQQFCEVLGVPRKLVREMDWYLRNMLGCINGRVYYNLYNWYKLIALLPGMSRNSEFMETMMGVREKLSGEVADRIRPHPEWATWRGTVRKTEASLRFLYYHFRIQSIVDGFLARFNAAYERFRRIDYSRMPGDAVFQKYLEMDRVMIGDWKAPIINDLLCMVHFGVLKKLTVKWLNNARPGLHNDLLAGEGNLESAEPTKELIRLAGQAAGNEALKRLIENTAAALVHETLRQSEHTVFCNEIESYIDRFGYRCMNEMKLEETDLLSDTSYLFVVLKNYLRSETTDRAKYELREFSLRKDAEAEVDAHVSGWRRSLYRRVLFHTRRSVRNRENTRFARTRAYGVARSMFQAIGSDLASLGVIRDSRDVFFLTIEEVYGIYQGTLTATNLEAVVALRKAQYSEFEEAEPAPRFSTRGAVYWKNIFDPKIPTEVPPAGADLVGLPCCPGIVEGEVRVIVSPREDLSLQGEILVAPRTDPGWVPLYPSISGLLVERGSLLSHSAIVAREMGIPTIVGIDRLCATLRSGMRIRMNGETGTVEILGGC